MMCEQCRKYDRDNPRIVVRARMIYCNAPVIVVQGDWICLKCNKGTTAHRRTVDDKDMYYLPDSERDEWSDVVDMMGVMRR